MLSTRSQGSLPSNIETHPKEHVKAVTLRSGKVLEDPTKLSKVNKQVEEHEEISSN